MNKTSSIIFHDATPAIADVASGAIPCPREPNKGESLLAWLAQTPTWRNLAQPGAVAVPLLGVAPLKRTGLTSFDYFFAVGSQLLAVNADGTRYALANAFDLLIDAWASAARENAGRPEKAEVTPRSLSQRRWRAKQSGKSFLTQAQTDATAELIQQPSNDEGDIDWGGLG